MGYFGRYFGEIPGGGSLFAPVLSNFVPAHDVTPGAPGAFSAVFSYARLTPIEFDITNIAVGAKISIAVKFGDRDETYVALDAAGNWRWPFDITGPGKNTIGELLSEPVHVTLLPRGGWRKGNAEIVVAAGSKANV